jgi:hydroxymethylpyrimidine pyrophosphatase-like HAD family hydrolase
MSIRLLALDLDGTLLNSRSQVSARNRESLDRARAAGVRVAVVTGRRFRDSRPIALELGLDVPVIAHNGALTKHAQTLETVAVLPLALDAARKAMEVGRAAGADALVSDDHEGLGVLVYDHIDGDNLPLQQYIRWAKQVHGDDEGDESVKCVDSLADYLDHEPIHVAFSGRCAPMSELLVSLRSSLGETVKILCTDYPQQDFTLIDVLNPAASKGAGVAAAATEMNLLPEEVMAVGDNYNDLEMLLFAGTGVVMANAPASMLTTSGLHVTASNKEDGVAQAIERFIFED